jgi:lipoprotein-anchoring transpeptidase ErfK/SrfK
VDGNKTIKKLLPVILAALVVVALVLVGWLVIAARSSDGGNIAQVNPTPIATATTSTKVTQHWMVGKATTSLVVRSAPADNAAIKWTLPARNANNYPQIVLIDSVRSVGSATWYRAYVAVRPNESRGWIREGALAIYQVTSRLDVDLSKRTLSVYVSGILKGVFNVAIGKPADPTPTGHYFINQKLQSSKSDGFFGVMAIGISAFQPKLPDWPQGGPVAIHGTNKPGLIGSAVSLGCVRMTNEDILKLSDLAPTGSPVFIHY